MSLGLSSCSFFESPKEVALHIQIDCKLYDLESKMIAQFPGYTCAFAPSGEWLSLTDSELSLFRSDNSLKYKYPDKIHHELKFSNDGKSIYYLSSEIKVFKNKKTRFDVLNVSDLNGKPLARWSTYDHQQELYQLLNLQKFDHFIPNTMTNAHFKADEQQEFSHVNAIYEIPKNSLEDNLPYMKSGNLVVTFNGLGSILIFDPGLKRILHSFDKFIDTKLYGFHDAQILPNGHLIFFKNVGYRDGVLVTSLEEFDILKERSVWSFVFEKPNFAHNEINGSVQVLENDNVFIGENSLGGRALEISRDGEVQWLKYSDSNDRVKPLPSMIYRAKKIQLDSFLKNNILGAWARDSVGIRHEK